MIFRGLRTLPYRLLATAFALGLFAAAGGDGTAKADPPPWAPAHGYRAKHKHRGEPVYVVQPLPYGIDRGLCDRGIVSSEVVGGVLGGAAGGVLGAQIGKGRGKTAATIGGTIIGVLVGSSIGRTMDQVDQNCIGRILEYAPDRQQIVWSNADNGYQYAVVPTRTFERGGAYCREYQTTATIGGRRQQVYGTACRQPDGSWKIVD